ncbi:MAG: flagellar basal body-associated FliL family protein [Agathobacter sp.]|nr:flagellar basal body-associated FliL family protein [Agathobacter sp.]
MKKNLMTLIILALLVVNLVMTAVMMFVMVPQTQRANEMITKVCEAIDLELNSGAATGLSNLPIDRIVTYDVASGESITVNLKGNSGYAVVSVSISVDNESETYTEKNGTEYLSSKESIIKDAIIKIIGNYTKDELSESKSDMEEELLKSLKKTFGADYVVGISFTKFTMD